MNIRIREAIDPFREGNEKRRYLYAHACSIHDRRHRDASCLSSIPNAFEKGTPMSGARNFACSSVVVCAT